MAFNPKKLLGKFFKYIGISIITLLALMFLLPYLFPNFVSNKIKQWANSSIEAELNFSKARLSFFNHFPSLTLTLYDVNLKGSAPFKQDTLVNAKEVALGVNLASIFGKTLKIDEIYFTKGKMNVLVNDKGIPNYNVYVAKPSATNNANDTSSTALKLERIQIEECELVYNDQSIPMVITAKQLDYVGKGDLSKAIFDLSSNIKMQSFSISYAKQQFLENKDLEATLVTQINTNSLAFIFEKNDLQINQLPVEFKGKFDFLKDGYSMDFSLKTKSTEFKNLFTALPPSAVTWVDKTTVKGDITMNAALKGDYLASKKIAPDVSFSMNINKGSIMAKNMKEPVENIYLNFHFNLPQLNMEAMTVKIDSLHASMGKDEIIAVLETKGMAHPFINGNINAHADIEKWNKTINIDSTIDLKGLFVMNGKFSGSYNPQAKQFPIANVSLHLKDGFVQTSYYPSPISNIQIDVDVFNTKGTTEDLKVNIKPISLHFEGEPFMLKSDLKNFNNLSYNISSKGILNIGKIYQLFAVKGYNVKGLIEADFNLQGTQADAMAGRYGKLHNKGTLKLMNIKMTSTSFPKPFLIESGAFHFKDDKLMADKVNMNYGSTTAFLNGYINNIINYALKDNAALKGNLTLNTQHLFVDELMAFAPDSTAKKSTVTTATGVVVIPSNLDLQFHANANIISYNGLDLKNWQSATSVQNGQLNISKAAFTLIDAPVNMTATYASINEHKAKFDYHITANEFDIKKAYNEIKLFRDITTAAGKAEGIVSLDYQLSGLLNDSMYPIFPTLKGGGVLSLKKVKVKGLKMFSAISKETGVNKVNNPDLSKVDIKTKIANNIITIERFKLRVFGFRPRFEGQASFDGRLNLKARLGLPPFGIFGIPLSITGTQEKPIVKLRRGRKSDELKEIKPDEDSDEEDKKEAAEAASKEEAEKKKEQS